MHLNAKHRVAVRLVAACGNASGQPVVVQV